MEPTTEVPGQGTTTAPATEPAGQPTEAARTQPDASQARSEPGKTDAQPVGTKERPRIEVPEKRQKDLERMGKLFPGLQKKTEGQSEEIVRLRQELEEARRTRDDHGPFTPSRTDQDTDPLKHPAIRGLQQSRDDDGNTLVDYHGTLMAPETVIALTDSQRGLESKLDALASELQGRREQETAAQEAARIQAAEKAVTTSIAETVTDMIPTAFPNAGEKRQAVLARRLSNDTQDNLADLVEQAKAEGELSAEIVPRLVQQAIVQAFEAEAEADLEESVGRQREHNSQYAKDNPVRPGGTPGAPAAQRPRSPAEADREAREEADRLMARFRQ